MTENKFEIVEPDDPRRCQAVHGKGQCKYKAVDGSDRCPMHGGNLGADAARKQVLHRYRLAKWQSQIDHFAEDDDIKNLRGEVGILRMNLEQLLNRCNDASDLLLYQAKIGDQVMKIEKLVSSCHRIESQTGQLLDKPKVLALAANIVEIISKHVSDEDVIAAVSEDLVNAILEAQGITTAKVMDN